MASQEYSSISSTEEFTTIDIENFTFNELKDELDGILLNYAKAGKLNFAKEEKQAELTPIAGVAVGTKTKGEYEMKLLPHFSQVQ